MRKYIHAIARSIQRAVASLLGRSRSILEWIPEDLQQAIFDGTSTDDHTIYFRNAISDLEPGATLRLEPGKYNLKHQSEADTEILLFEHPISLVGEGINCVLAVDSTVPATCDVLKIKPTSDYANYGPGDPKFAHVTWSGFRVECVGANPAKDCIAIDSTDAIVWHCRWEHLYLFPMGGLGFHAVNSTFARGLMNCSIEHNVIWNGIKLENCDDNNHIFNNIVSGANWGLEMTAETGAVQNQVEKNSFVGYGGGLKFSGSRVKVLYNSFENVLFYPNQSTEGASIVVDGGEIHPQNDPDGKSLGSEIIGNSLGPGQTYSGFNGIRLVNAWNTIIDHNVGHVWFTQLVNSIDASQTSFVVYETTGLTVPHDVQVGDEHMTVNSIDGGGSFGAYTVNVTRGVNGTTAAAHTNARYVIARDYLIVTTGKCLGLKLGQNNTVWPLTDSSQIGAENLLINDGGVPPVNCTRVGLLAGRGMDTLAPEAAVVPDRHTFAGYNAGSDAIRGTNSTFLGADSTAGDEEPNYRTVVGSGAVGLEDNAVTLGRATDKVLVPGWFVARGTNKPPMHSAPAETLRGMMLATRSGTNDLYRWYLVADATAETGSNAGSNFALIGYLDDGTPQTVMTANRATKAVGFPGAVTADTLTSTGNATAPYFVGAAYGPTHVCNGNAGTSRGLLFGTAGSNRAFLLIDAVAESGSNAGSDMHLTMYNDAGTSLGDVFSVTRSTRVLDFKVAPTVNGVGLASSTHNHSGVYEPANANIQSHISNTSNPHSVTAAQVLPSLTGNGGKTLKVKADESGVEWV